MSERAGEALAAAVKALPTDPVKARKVFVIATEDDPGMADGWLGRVASGDRSLGTLARLMELAGGLGQDLRRSISRRISWGRISRWSMCSSRSRTSAVHDWLMRPR